MPTKKESLLRSKDVAHILDHDEALRNKVNGYLGEAGVPEELARLAATLVDVRHASCPHPSPQPVGDQGIRITNHTR